MEVVIFVGLVFGVLCALLAGSKGRSSLGWFILGGLFSIIALALLALLPSLKPEAEGPTPDTHVKCPDCRELVLIDARVCKHCGCRLSPVA